jgi:hypothetical protein
MKKPDSRCCGSGVCIISDAGECWCGQKWDGEKMAYVPLDLNQSQDEAIQNKITDEPKSNKT